MLCFSIFLSLESHLYGASERSANQMNTMHSVYLCWLIETLNAQRVSEKEHNNQNSATIRGLS